MTKSWECRHAHGVAESQFVFGISGETQYRSGRGGAEGHQTSPWDAISVAGLTGNLFGLPTKDDQLWTRPDLEGTQPPCRGWGTYITTMTIVGFHKDATSTISIHEDPIGKFAIPLQILGFPRCFFFPVGGVFANGSREDSETTASSWRTLRE